MAFYPFTGGLTSALRGTGTAALVGVGTTGDTVNRLELDADGVVRFGSGSGAVDTGISRSAAGQVTISNTLVTSGAISVNGVLDVASVGAGLQIKEGTNAKQGVATLVAGTVTVANTSTTAVSRILATGQAAGGTPGGVNVSTRTAGTSFTLTSTNAADTSTVAYEMLEPG